MTVTAPPDTLVPHRTGFPVSGPRDHVTFDERSAADLIPAGGDFAGCITWATEQVPDQLVDPVVDEDAAGPHRPSTAADWFTAHQTAGRTTWRRTPP